MVGMEDIIQLVSRVAKSNGVDPLLMLAIVQHESGFDPSAMGDNGRAYGLCQIWLTTAQGIGYTGTPQQLLDPETNIYWGSKYLKMSLDKFSDVRDAISGYNSGLDGVVHPWVDTGYVQSVYMRYVQLSNMKGLNGLMPLFFPLALLTAILTYIQAGD